MINKYYHSIALARSRHDLDMKFHDGMRNVASYLMSLTSEKVVKMEPLLRALEELSSCLEPVTLPLDWGGSEPIEAPEYITLDWLGKVGVELLTSPDLHRVALLCRCMIAAIEKGLDEYYRANPSHFKPY